MNCKSCGAEIPDGTIFCYNCGTKVEPEISHQKTQEKPISNKKVLIYLIINILES